MNGEGTAIVTPEAAGRTPEPETLVLFGVPFRRMRFRAALHYLQRLAQTGRRVVYFANAHTLNLAWNDREFRETLGRADAVFNDGSGVFLASLLRGRPFRDNLCGTDLVPELYPYFIAQGWPLFLLGGRADVVETAARRIERSTPGLNIVGTRSGYFASPAEEEALIQRLRDLRPRVLLVGMGQPLQEQWIDRNLDALPEPILVMGVGGFFDIFSGRLKRPPKPVRRAGMEWTWRLAQQPRYVWRRYLIGNPLFLSRAARDAASLVDFGGPEAPGERPAVVNLFGLEMDALDVREVTRRVGRAIASKRGLFAITPNSDFVMLARRVPDLQRLFNTADLRLCDSVPLLWMSRALGRPLPERLNGTDLFEHLALVAGDRGWRIFLLGGLPGAAQRAAAVLRFRHPGLQVVGCEAPPSGFENDPEENRRVVERIRAASPDLLFVGLGTPKQERWITSHRAELGACVALGVGASFDFVSGLRRRAPGWMQRGGLEWLHRLMQEPRRLWPRYLLHDSPIMLLFARELLRTYLRPRKVAS